MKTILSIPSGNRVKKLLKCIEKWRKVCDFEIHVITWDSVTMEALRGTDFVLYTHKPMQSFAKNQNELADITPDWDIFICGADDLYPGNNIHLIEPVCRDNPDKVIWVKDGLYDAQPTHPIITRGWYEKHGYIFDEGYKHNFCDTDLFVRLLNAGEVVKCFDIAFDHRHPLKGAKYDSIYFAGEKNFEKDQMTFMLKHPFADADMKINVKKCPEVRV